MYLVFDANLSSIRVIFDIKFYREQDDFNYKRILDTFIVPFHYTKTAQADNFNNCTQRVRLLE